MSHVSEKPAMPKAKFIAMLIPLLWRAEIHGSVAHSDASCVLTAPRFGDGNRRGGWWARYDHDTGAMLWRRHHQRGANLFAVTEDVIIATTHRYSGCYGICLSTGKKLWSRLGDRFNLLLKAFEYLPGLDNVGDGPQRIMDGNVLTRAGRLLDYKTGRVLSRHHIEYDWGPPQREAVDGKPVEIFRTPRFQYGGMSIHPDRPEAIDAALTCMQLETSGPQWCSQRCGEFQLVIARATPPGGSRPPSPGQVVWPVDVPHFFLIMRDSDKQVVHQEELGGYSNAEIAWCDGRTLALTMKTAAQCNWGYRRDVSLYDLSRLQTTR